MTSPGDLRVLETVRNNLTREFAGVFSPETVAACLAEFLRPFGRNRDGRSIPCHICRAVCSRPSQSNGQSGGKDRDKRA